MHTVSCPELANPGNGTVTVTSSNLVCLGLGSKASYFKGAFQAMLDISGFAHCSKLDSIIDC